MGILGGNLNTLKALAIYGGALSFLGAGYFATKIQNNFRKQEFYKESMKLLRGYPVAIKLMGQPIVGRRLNLSSADNYVDGYEARLSVPVDGPKGSAILHTWCSRPSLDHKWIVQKLDLEVNGKQWTFYINPEATDQYKPTKRLDDVLQSSKHESDDENKTFTSENDDNKLKYLDK